MVESSALPSIPTLALASVQSVNIGVSQISRQKKNNSLKILHFDSRDEQLISVQLAAVLAFSGALAIHGQLTALQLRSALEQAHIASDGYYSQNHAELWNTDFEFPPDAIIADAQLWIDCGRDLTYMCKTKQHRLAPNRLSVEHVLQVSDDAKYPTMLHSDFLIILDFAAHGITPILADDFKAQAQNEPPLRARYLTLKHTVNCLLYKQHVEGTVLFIKRHRQTYTGHPSKPAAPCRLQGKARRKSIRPHNHCSTSQCAATTWPTPIF